MTSIGTAAILGAVISLGNGSFLDGDRDGESAIRLSAGFTAGPSTGLTAFELDHFLTDYLAIAPLLQVGVSDDEFIFAPSVGPKVVFDVRGARRLLPFVQGGVGFAYVDDEDDGDDTAFLVMGGGGVEYFVTDRLSLGTAAFFNVLPGEVHDDEFFFSWHLITFTVWF